MNAKNVNINPCHMCMPMGGVLAFKGIEKSVVVIHGSQGCSTYIRRHIAEHFNEPVDVGSTSLNEKGTVYGGEDNLKKGLENIIRVYNPKMIGVLTTCLAETIGEDIKRMTETFIKDTGLSHVQIIPVHTAGYSGSHSEGFFSSVRRILENTVIPSEPNGKIGLIIPNISPADIRELKRMMKLFSLPYVVLPDFSDSLDGVYQKQYLKLSPHGTKIKDIQTMSGLKAIIEFSATLQDDLSPGEYMKKEYGVPLYRIPLPVGLRFSDQLISVLREISGKKAPKMLLEERGRLLDAMIDAHKHNAQGKTLLYLEPEQLYATISLLEENGVGIVLAATGSEYSTIAKKEIRQKDRLFTGADFDLIFKEAEGQDIDFAIGNSDGRVLTEKRGIPLLRRGFPIHDRMGGGRILSVGYAGSIQLLDSITNMILDKKLTSYRQQMTEKLLEPLKNGAESRGESYGDKI